MLKKERYYKDEYKEEGVSYYFKVTDCNIKNGISKGFLKGIQNGKEFKMGIVDFILSRKNLIYGHIKKVNKLEYLLKG